ncbi:GA2L1 protein, partial [Centropus unirufus]|nr:GA2L1 protein [Centropus unirufus]
DGAAEEEEEAGELPELVRRLREPLEPAQEQRLLRRLEEEFLANTRLLQELEEPRAAPADSAYCSSSSSSSSLCVPGAGPAPRDAGRRAALSSSSDESSCFPAPWEARAGSDTDWAPGEDEESPAERPPRPAASPRLHAKPRLDTQPHRKPSRIPTPRGHGAAPPAGSSRPWGALQSAFSSHLELGEDAWP